MHCWWECKLKVATVKMKEAPQKLKLELLYDPATLGKKQQHYS